LNIHSVSEWIFFNEEKDIYFQTTHYAENIYNCKLYGAPTHLLDGWQLAIKHKKKKAPVFLLGGQGPIPWAPYKKRSSIRIYKTFGQMSTGKRGLAHTGF